MAHGLDILFIDDHPGGDRVLNEALTQRCRQILVVAHVRAGIAALERARATGSRFGLVVGNLMDLAGEGLALMRELQRCRDPVPVILTADFGTIDPLVAAEAQRLGVREILDTPIEPVQVAEALAQVEASAGRGLALEPAALPPQHQMHDSLLPPRVMVQRQQTTGRILSTAAPRQRRSLDTPLPVAPPIGTPRHLTRATPLPVAAAAAIPPDPGKVRGVICGSCRNVVRVEIKPAAYSTLCVHCGGMLRVEPG